MSCYNHSKQYCLRGVVLERTAGETERNTLSRMTMTKQIRAQSLRLSKQK